MYRKLFIIVFALMLAVPVFAQQSYSDAKRVFKREYREAHRYDPVTHAFRFQYSQKPFFAKTNFSGYTIKQMKNYFDTQKGSLAYVYSDYAGSVRTTGSFIAGYDMIFTSGCTFSCDLAVNFLWRERYNGIDGQKVDSKKGTVIYFMPKFKYYYLTRDMIRLYGDVGLGAGLYFGFASRIRPAFQFTPFGLEVGHKVYGIFELGAGSLYVGGSVGVGYKF